MDDTRHDTTQSRDATDVSHDTTHTTVDVSEAAAILGISEDAVRARIRRGKLQGEKVGAVWRVHLGEEINDDNLHIDPTDTTAGRATRHDSATVDLAPLAEMIEKQMKQISDLSAAVGMWQSRAMHLDGEVKQVREQLQEANEKLQQLTATTTTAGEHGTDEAVESPERDDTDDHDHEHQREETSVPVSVWARLWRRIAGMT